MLKQVKLLKETFRSLAGAQKRCSFENGIAKNEFERGDKVRCYVYTILKENEVWRIVRNVRQ